MICCLWLSLCLAIATYCWFLLIVVDWLFCYELFDLLVDYLLVVWL